MPKANPQHTAPPRAGQIPSDRGLIELATCLQCLSVEQRRLRDERDELADGHDKRALQFNQHLLGQCNSNWWRCVESITALPAMGIVGMRLKAAVIHAIECQRNTNDPVNDCSASDAENRLAVSLADDIKRWAVATPAPVGRVIAR
jgi:hypothetical protein